MSWWRTIINCTISAWCYVCGSLWCGWLILLATRGQWPLEVYILFATLDFSIIQLSKKQWTAWRLMLARRQAMSTCLLRKTQVLLMQYLAFPRAMQLVLWRKAKWTKKLLLGTKGCITTGITILVRKPVSWSEDKKKQCPFIWQFDFLCRLIWRMGWKWLLCWL